MESFAQKLILAPVVVLIGWPVMFLAAIIWKQTKDDRRAVAYWREKFKDDSVLRNDTLLRSSSLFVPSEVLVRPTQGGVEGTVSELLRSEYSAPGPVEQTIANEH